MNQRLVVILLLWLSVMMPLWAAERVALVIGNSAYQYAPRLHNPANDALGVSAALERLGFHVTRVNEADYNSLRRGLAEFRQHTRTAELALLYYAGHAIQVDGINYLVPVDAQITDPSDVSLHLVELETALQQLQGAINVVILDACRDNPFAETLTQVAQSQNRSLGLGRGLGRVPMVSGGAYLMMAAAPGAVAQDGLPGGHSPYTAALLQHLETPGLDLRLLQAEIRSAVEQTTGGRQSPEAIDRLPPRPIYLAGGSLRTDAPAAPAHRGQLTITSQPPGAQLYLDGALLGTAPQTLSAPAQGREQVQIEARLTGYPPRQERVWLRAGQDSTLRLLLQAETPAVQPQRRWINTAQANVRSGPGTSHGVVTQLVQGTEVLWLGVSDQDSVWQQIRLNDGREAYIHGGLLSTQAVAALPPPPTERPTAPSASASATTGSLIAGRYEVRGRNGDIIYDTTTRLEWQRCSLGQTWNGHTCTGEINLYTWDEARAAAARVSGWRLPTIEELRTLVYCSSEQPARFKNSSGRCLGNYQQPTIVSEVFPNTPASYFWSASPYAGRSDGAWGVSFDYGNDHYWLKSVNLRVRLVRGGQ